MSESLIVVLLSLLLGIQAITTDLYLPAVPLLSGELGATPAQSQLTLTGLLLAFGVSQLVWGPLSDRFGRRPILWLGLAGYTVGALGAVLSPSIEYLIVWRILQGAAMGASVMGSRAIVRDLYSPLEGARMMSRALTGLGVIACLSAPLGGVLAQTLGWRSALTTLVVYGVITFLLMHGRFKETLPQRNLQALQPRVLLRTWLSILKHPSFRAFALQTMGAFGVLFTFLATSPFVFVEVLGLSKATFGLVLFTASGVYILGTLLCRACLPRFGIRRTLQLASGCSATGAVLMALVAYTGWASAPSLLLPFLFMMLAHGIHQPISQSGAVGPFPQAAGAASALSGFLMTLVGFVTGSWLGQRLDGTVFPFIEGELFWAAWLVINTLTLVRWHGEARER
jgi:DHA1 family bicyclomycin/chloramphenicol resistance-like MFS transporter